MPVICRLCDKEFKRITPTHLQHKHNGMTMIEYRKMFPDAPTLSLEARRRADPQPIEYTITCPNCGKTKTFEKKTLCAYEQKFCCHSCANSYNSKKYWEDPEYRQKRHATMEKKRRDPEYIARHLAAMRDPIHRAAASLKQKQYWDNHPERKEEHSKRAHKMFTKLWSDPEWAATQVQKVAKGWTRRPSIPELALATFLKGNGYSGYKYTGDGTLWLGRRNPDFVWHEGHRIIEMFGVYWHDESEVDPRIKHFAEHGFQALIIWDYELKDTEQLLAKLKNFHQG